jgi:hypothetical protein
VAPSPKNTYIRREKLYAPDGTYLGTLIFHGEDPFSLAELPYLTYLFALDQYSWLRNEQEKKHAG